MDGHPTTVAPSSFNLFGVEPTVQYKFGSLVVRPASHRLRGAYDRRFYAFFLPSPLWGEAKVRGSEGMGTVFQKPDETSERLLSRTVSARSLRALDALNIFLADVRDMPLSVWAAMMNGSVGTRP